MVKKILFIVVLIVVLQLVIAVETPIKIKTLADHRISIIIRQAGQMVTAESFHQNTGSGELTVTSTVSFAEIDLLVTLKKDGENIITRNYETIKTGGELFLNFIPGEEKLQTAEEVAAAIALAAKENVTKEAVSNTTTTPVSEASVVSEINKPTEVVDGASAPVEEPPEPQVAVEIISSGFTTKAISEAILNASPFKAFLIGLVIVLVIAALVWIVLTRTKEKGNDSYRIKKLSDLQEEMRIKNDPVPTKIKDIEKKIKDLQTELTSIKQQDQHVKELKERMQRDKEELQRLERLE